MTEVAADALSVVKAVAEPAAQSGGKHLVIFSKLFFSREMKASYV